MKKIDRNTLVAYLYGELDQTEITQVQHYLDENPAAKEEFERLSSTRLQLQQVGDESISQPVFFTNRNTHHTNEWRWHKWVAAAAILLGIIYSAAWLNIRISFRNQELAIQFGDTKSAQDQKRNTLIVVPESEVEISKISSPKSATTGSIDSLALKRIALLEQKLQRQIQGLQLRQNALQASQTGLTAEQVTDLMNDLQQENFETMQQLMSTASHQQQLYSQQMLTQLTEYLASQRKEDLQKINTVLNTIVQNTDQKQQQTDFVLTQVISKLNEGGKNVKGKN